MSCGHWTLPLSRSTYLGFGIQQAVLPEVCDPAHEVENPIPHGDHGILGEDDGLSAMPGNSELGKDDA